MNAQAAEARTSLPLEDEPHDTLEELVRDHGAGCVVQALSRVLMKRRRDLRVEGELDGARAMRRASVTLSEEGDALRAAYL